jgi:enamine deaminase RidA (YjgF/YER057c/UK114 family)
MVLPDGAGQQARLGLRHVSRVLDVFGCTVRDVVQVGATFSQRT